MQSPIPEIRINNSDEPYQDDPETARMDEDELRRANQDVMQMQQRMMEGEYSYFKKIPQTKLMSLTSTVDQDDQLDALAKAIARQRDLSLNISSELELHEDLIDETDRALDQYVTLTHLPSVSLTFNTRYSQHCQPPWKGEPKP